MLFLVYFMYDWTKLTRWVKDIAEMQVLNKYPLLHLTEKLQKGVCDLYESGTA